MRRVLEGIVIGAGAFLPLCLLWVSVQIAVDFLSVRLPFGTDFYRALIVASCLGGMVGTVRWMMSSRDS